MRHRGGIVLLLLQILPLAARRSNRSLPFGLLPLCDVVWQNRLQQPASAVCFLACAGYRRLGVALETTFRFCPAWQRPGVVFLSLPGIVIYRPAADPAASDVLSAHLAPGSGQMAGNDCRMGSHGLSVADTTNLL